MQNKIIVDSNNILSFKRMIKQIDNNETNIIIVPDKFSLNAEKMFLDENDLTVNFNTRIFSLSKLASAIIEKKLIDKKIIDKTQSLMIISSIIKENINNFKYFKNIKDINSFAEDVFNSLSQLLSSNFEKENENITGLLKNKFDDINLILNIYKQKRAEVLVDSSYKFDLFLSEIKNSEIIKTSNFYFGMFNNFTPQVKKIIKEIYLNSKSCNFSCSFSENRVNNNEVLDFYKSIDKQIKIIKEDSLNEINKFINTNFFTSKQDKFNLKNDEIKIYEAKNPDEEIDNVIYNIKKDVLLDKLRFNDICVACASEEKYKDIIEEKFAKANISYFEDTSISLKDFSYFRFLLDLLNSINNLKLNVIINLIDSGYIDIDEKIIQNFKSFIYNYNIENFDNVKKYEIFSNEKEYEDFNFITNNIVLKINNLHNKKFNNVYEFFDDFDNLLKEFNVKEKLKEKTTEFLDSDIKKYKQFLQLEDKFEAIKQNILDYYNEDFSLNKLIYFFNICLQNMNVSLASTSVDSVFVGDSLNSYFKNYKKIYIVGATSLDFPNLKNSNGIFSDDEVKQIETTEISPKIEDINRLNFYRCMQLILSSENLVISYPNENNDGVKNFPSIFIKNFLKRFNLKMLKVNIDSLNLLDFNEILNILPFKLYDINSYEREFYKQEGKVKDVILEILKHKNVIEFKNTEKQKIDLSLLKSGSFSSSSLEDYFACSYRYFYKDVLKLKKIEQVKLDARIFGNIIHNCCYYFAEKIIKKSDVDILTMNKIIDFVLNKPEYEFLKLDKTKNAIISNLKVEIIKLFNFILKQQESCEFKIAKAEYLFKTQIDGVNFKGFIDRIDETEDEFIIIDYKTGKTIIDYEEIILNKKIQLILYAKILEKILNKKCVGVFYLTLNDNYLKSGEKSINFNGILVKTNNSENKLKVNDGFFNINEKYILTEKQFDNLKEFVFNNILNAIKIINGGFFTENPIKISGKSCCDYCEFSEICKQKVDNEKEFDENLLKEILDD